MTGKEFSVLIARIKEELNNIDSLYLELKRNGIIKGKNQDTTIINVKDDTFVLRATASVLHDFYVSVENIFKMICKDIDESLPEGSDWHIQLLRQVSMEIPGIRPRVISKSLMVSLDEFRGFRHVFRNVYGFNLNSKRIKDLLISFPETIKMLERELELFVEQLGKVMP